MSTNRETTDYILGIVGNVLLFLLVFSMSATVDVDCMKIQMQNYKAIAVGAIAQFFILPILGFLTVNMIPSLSYPVGLMILVVTSSPGGSYSNWWCSMFNADLALSVTMTAISTLLSIVMLPLNLLIYTKFTYEADVLQNLDWHSIFISLIIVITAISGGLYCSYAVHNHTFNRIANNCGNTAGFLLIVFSATLANFSGSSSSNNDNNGIDGVDTATPATRIWNRDASFYAAVILPCICGLLISIVLTSSCNLLKPERVTVAIETCYQNVGIATSLALTMFDTPEDVTDAIGVPFLYGIVEAVVVGTLCIVSWKAGWTKAPPDAPFWKVISTSYEVLEAELKDLDGIEVAVNDSDESKSGISSTEESQEGTILTTYYIINKITSELLDPKPYQPPQRQLQPQPQSQPLTRAPLVNGKECSTKSVI